MKRYYLDKIKVTERHDLWNPEDKRQKQWAKERDKYGFDERETWSLNSAWHLWLYERLMMYKEVAAVDLNYHKFKYKRKVYTQLELIDMMLERLKFSFSKDYNDWDEKQSTYVGEVEQIWALVCRSMWW